MLALKSHHCEHCGRDFVSRLALKYHFCQKHLGKVRCEKCGQEVLREKLQDHTQMSTGFSLHNMLEYKSPQELQRFADEKIRPASGPLRAACVAEIGALVQLIQRCFLVLASRVIQGGSYKKGTDRGCSEINIVLVSDVFASVNHCKKELREGLAALRKNLKQTSLGNRILMGKRVPLSLRFNFLCTESLHSPSFEIMAYYDVLGPTPSTDLKLHLYRKLYLCNDSDEAQLCALALLPYQVDFVKTSVGRVKELIRLVIHWFETSFASPTEENKFQRLPSSYTVELLTIYIWELAEKPLFFSLVQGPRAILKPLVPYAEINVVWHRHYHRRFPIFVKVNQKHTRPFILDPVNPTVNMCDTCNAWDEVAHVARWSLLEPLFSGVRAEPPWLFTSNW